MREGVESGGQRAAIGERNAVVLNSLHLNTLAIDELFDLVDYFAHWRTRSGLASVWRWRREAVGGRRNGMSEAVRRSDAANTGRKQTQLRFPLSVRDERALQGCVNVRWSRTLNPKGFCFLRLADCF